jgi:1-phosphatidylinositol phosphodiesterase
MSKIKKKFSALNLIWIIPLAIVLAAVTVMFLIPAFESVDKAKVEGSGDWMAELPDDMSISEIVIPGTHDSATKNSRLPFFTKCQALSVREQLDAGFRYLDIRLAVDGERLKLMHGFVNCQEGGLPWSETLYLDSVLQDCYDFLREHPNETILFAVKKEYGDEPIKAFQSILHSYIIENPAAWAITDNIPTLGQVRGKIVLLRRYPDGILDGAAGISFIWRDQKGYEDVSQNSAMTDNRTYRLYVQDRFEYPLEAKWTAFTEGLKACEPGESNVLLSFLSTKGTPKYGHPFAYAPKLNKRLMETEEELKGWIVVDFGSAKLAEKIWSQNFGD